MIAEQPWLLRAPLAGLEPMDVEEANRLLVQWEHQLGPVNRPFGMQAFSFQVNGVPVAVAVSASAISKTVAGYRRGEVVELARLCVEPGSPWARVMIRLWREVCAQLWPYWPVKAGISYSKNALHAGNLYRFDGWEKVSDNCGSSGGGTYSRQRDATEAVYGPKTLWLWRYA